jgi:ABC-type dipeptide/oligopeptide/nickel transport system permease component
MTSPRITRSDLEARFQGFQDTVTGKIEDRRQTIIATVTAVSVVVLVIAYLLGRRSGRKRNSFVEIRRL